MNKKNLKRKKRAVIIGLDGVPYRLIENFSNNGVMPEHPSVYDVCDIIDKSKSQI